MALVSDNFVKNYFSDFGLNCYGWIKIQIKNWMNLKLNFKSQTNPKDWITTRAIKSNPI